jgi:hypothetical protein
MDLLLRHLDPTVILLMTTDLRDHHLGLTATEHLGKYVAIGEVVREMKDHLASPC